MIGRSVGNRAYCAELITEYSVDGWYQITEQENIALYCTIFSIVMSVLTAPSLHPKKIIFLDIDETLRKRTGETERLEDAAYERDPIAFFRNENGPLDPIAVSHLDYLLEQEPEAVIIITSDWSKGRTVMTLREHTLAKYQLADRIYDKIVESLNGVNAYQFCNNVAADYILPSEHAAQKLLPAREAENEIASLCSEDEVEQWKVVKEKELRERYQSLGLPDEERVYVYWKKIRNNFLNRSLKIMNTLAEYPKAEFVIFDDIFLDHFKKAYIFNPGFQEELGVFAGRFIQVDPETLLNRNHVERALTIFKGAI